MIAFIENNIWRIIEENGAWDQIGTVEVEAFSSKWVPMLRKNCDNSCLFLLVMLF